jgi:predicted transcriptional regulator
MKYRSRSDITAQILESANGGATKTKIMYKAFLSYAQLKEYLSILIENNLIDYEKETNSYKTTAKGHRLIKLYDNMGALVLKPQQEIGELPRL